MACKCDEAGDYSKCSVNGDNSDYAKRQSIPHTISLTRAELQAEWDKSCALVARLTEAVKTLAEERDRARHDVESKDMAMATLTKQRDYAQAIKDRVEKSEYRLVEQRDKLLFACSAMLAAYKDQAITTPQRIAENMAREAISSVEK